MSDEISTIDLEKVLRELRISLDAIADKFDSQQRDLDISKVSFASGGAVGGVMTIVGLALIPITFGVSSGLAIAGGVVGGLSATGGISSLAADKIISSKTKTKVQEMLKEVAKESEIVRTQTSAALRKLDSAEGNCVKKLIAKCPCISKEVKACLFSVIDESDVASIGVKVVGASNAVKNVVKAAKLLTLTVRMSSALQELGAGAGAAAGAVNAGRSIGIAADVGTDAAATAGKVVASGARAAGFALAGVGVALDIGAIVYYSIKIHRNKPSELAAKFRAAADALNETPIDAS